MTALPPAQSRPPPSIPPLPNLFRSPRRQPSRSRQEVISRSAVDAAGSPDIESNENGRTPKRRKIEQPAHVREPSTPVPTAPISTEPQLGGDSASTRISAILPKLPEDDALAEDGLPAPDLKLPALPSRPWKNKVMIKTSFEEGKSNSRVRKNVPVPNVPDIIEPPENAPKCGKCRLAGFFPWTGHHPEDVVNETNIKQGYYDRPQNPPDKELSSAEKPLHATFKHRFSLDTLSMLFSLVLEQKNKRRTISSGSTFKPPPRVTLTEAKRKSWLTDLANPDIPLRRLNRTIPQGIRGQSLLDQCLHNAVPISRAVWFAKCVGANEIRTLKRKGASSTMFSCNEGKWLREWTTNVEQFNEASIRDCAQPGWRINIQYVLRLCARLYLENLLDRDHYLDWIVKSFGSADINQTPFWLMVMHLYHRDLFRFRKRGKAMARALLEKLSTLTSSSESVMQPLIGRLKEFTRRFAMSRTICFLIPDQWPQLENALRHCFDPDTPSDQAIFDHLCKINERALGINSASHSAAKTPRQKLIEILDSAQGPFDPSRLSRACDEACPNNDVLISTLLEWATTRFRQSKARTFVVVRLLQQRRKLGQEVEEPLLKFVGESQCLPNIDFDRLHHHILELSRSRMFSTSRYIQWLTARGNLRKGSFEAVAPDKASKPGLAHQICTDPSQLLTEISLDHQDDHVVNLRNIFLSRLGFDPQLEVQVVENCKALLSRSLPTIVTSRHAPMEDATTLELNFNSFSWSVKSRIAVWLRHRVMSFCKVFWVERNTKGPLPGHKSIPIREFCLLRRVLEQMEDFTVLADVLGGLSASTQEDLLAAIADTINNQFDALAAIGAFDDLHQRVCNAYVALRLIKSSMPLLATSLTDLCRRHPSKLLSVRAIQMDLLKGDRGRAVAAFSPFSEGMAESLQQAGPTFIEDFEAILQSEPNMSEETMIQLFGVLTERISKEHTAAGDFDIAIILCQLLARLRLYRAVQCEALIEFWLERLVSGNASNCSAMLARLVSTGCASFAAVAKAIVTALRVNPAAFRARPNMLQALFLSDGADLEQDSVQYRLHLSRSQYESDHPLEALKVLSAVKTADRLGEKLEPTLPSLVSKIILGRLFPTTDLPKVPSKELTRGLDRILHLGKNTPADFSSIAKRADDLSFPFCNLRLKLLADTSNTESSDIDMADVFFNIANDDSQQSSSGANTKWPVLLHSTKPEIAHRVQRKAEEAFFASLPSALQPKSFISTLTMSPEEHLKASQKSLNIAFSAAQEPVDVSSSTVATQLIEKFSLLLKCLGSTGPTSAPTTIAIPTSAVASASRPVSSDPLVIVDDYLPLLLKMICLQRPAFSSLSASSKQVQQDQIKILVLLVSIATSSALATTASSSTAPTTSTLDSRQEPVSFVLDVAATLVDDLSDDARALCARFLKDKMVHPRVAELFGSVNSMGSVMSADVGAGLQVVKQPEPGGHQKVMGEWKVRQWEVLEGGVEPWVGLGVFGAQKG